jgi:hypothetical protein
MQQALNYDEQDDIMFRISKILDAPHEARK